MWIVLPISKSIDAWQVMWLPRRTEDDHIWPNYNSKSVSGFERFMTCRAAHIRLNSISRFPLFTSFCFWLYTFYLTEYLHIYQLFCTIWNYLCMVIIYSVVLFSEQKLVFVRSVVMQYRIAFSSFIFLILESQALSFSTLFLILPLDLHAVNNLII